MYVQNVCAWCPQEPEVIDLLQLEWQIVASWLVAPGYALKEQPVLLVTEPSLQSQHLLVPAQAPIFLNDIEIFYFVVCDQYLEFEFNSSKSLAIFGSFFSSTALVSGDTFPEMDSRVNVRNASMVSLYVFITLVSWESKFWVFQANFYTNKIISRCCFKTLLMIAWGSCLCYVSLYFWVQTC